MIGYSMGGAASVRPAAEHTDVGALVLLGNALRLLGEELPPFAHRIMAVRNLYVDGVPRTEVTDQMQTALRQYLPQIPPKPLLAIVGREDPVNTEEKCQEMLALLTGPKSTIVVDCNHFGIPNLCAKPLLSWLQEQGFAEEGL